MQWREKIFKHHSGKEFEDLSFEVFRYQMEHCEVYASYVSMLKRNNPATLKEIPFLPISFFKSHKVVSNLTDHSTQIIFKSSGTGGLRSTHFVSDIELYKDSFSTTFSQFFGAPSDFIFLALLPNYIEQGDSSLVFMVSELMNASKSPYSEFILNDALKIKAAIKAAKDQGKTIVLFGVAYSLLDLIDQKVDLSECTVVETGGMKGRRKEVSKSELYLLLKEKLGIQKLYSEYGMTELLSQAYCLADLTFHTPSWMQVMFRDPSDPFTLSNGNKSSGLNIVDLANVHSCSFIATDDLGIKVGNGFQILGRMDSSDIRGCNLLIE